MFLVIVNSAAVNIGVHVSLLILVSLLCMPSSGVAGSYGSYILSATSVFLSVSLWGRTAWGFRSS